jgi:hypothetical protein
VARLQVRAARSGWRSGCRDRTACYPCTASCCECVACFNREDLTPDRVLHHPTLPPAPPLQTARCLTSDERDGVYNRGAREEFDEPDYSMVDTLFSLAESYLFSQLVELAVRAGARAAARSRACITSSKPLGRSCQEQLTAAAAETHHRPRNPQDKDPGSIPHGRAYQLIWRDVRSAVDLAHRDGTLKREVAANPSKYIHDVSGAGGVGGLMR